VSWWTGDDTFADLQGQNNGTEVGTVKFAPGEVLDAFQINGGSAYVQIAEPSTIDSVISSQMTIEGWVNIVSSNTTNRILDKGYFGTSGGYIFDVINGYLRFSNGVNSAVSSYQMADGGVNGWVHVAGTWDANANGGTGTVYINGEQAGTVTSAGTIPTNTQNVRIGADNQGGSNFQGSIDELAVYKAVLTPAQIAAIYQAGTSGRCK
jgi:hypothetical protein